MIIKNTTLEYKTKGEYEFEDITDEVHKFVKKSGIKDGLVNIQTLHTTNAVIVNEKIQQLQILSDDLKKSTSIFKTDVSKLLMLDTAKYDHVMFVNRIERCLDGKEQIARLCRPRIRAGGFDGCVRPAADYFGAAGFGNKFQRACFHKIISTKMSRSPRR